MRFILIILIIVASFIALSACQKLDYHRKSTTEDSSTTSDKPTSDNPSSPTPTSDNPSSPTPGPEKPSSPPGPEKPSSPAVPDNPSATPNPNNPNPSTTPNPNNPNPTTTNPNNPNPTTSLPGSQPTTAPPTTPPPPNSGFPTVLASAKVASDVEPPVPLKNGKMAGLLVFYQPTDGKTSITGYLNNLLDDAQGKYTFKIVSAKGTLINDLTGMINPIFQLGGSSTFSTIQDKVRLSGDAATSAIGNYFVITQRDVAICKALITTEFTIGA